MNGLLVICWYIKWRIWVASTTTFIIIMYSQIVYNTWHGISYNYNFTITNRITGLYINLLLSVHKETFTSWSYTCKLHPGKHIKINWPARCNCILMIICVSKATLVADWRTGVSKYSYYLLILKLLISLRQLLYLNTEISTVFYLTTHAK